MISQLTLSDSRSSELLVALLGGIFAISAVPIVTHSGTFVRRASGRSLRSSRHVRAAVGPSGGGALARIAVFVDLTLLTSFPRLPRPRGVGWGSPPRYLLGLRREEICMISCIGRRPEIYIISRRFSYDFLGNVRKSMEFKDVRVFFLGNLCMFR